MLQFVPAPNLGKNRNKFIALLNKKVGPGNWYWAFQFSGNKLYSWNLGIQLYEDAYWVFFKNNLTRLKEIIKNYGDVYVFDKTDLKSGLDYKKQMQMVDHYEDIAIRRCMRRFGLWFKGDNLLKIPGSDLQEAKIPFHLSHLLSSENKTLNALHQHLVAILAIEMGDKQELTDILIR
jgi:hypothetical protein